MGTLVCFHAHPDDESIATGGTIARAVSEGHRVVLVVATDGRHGESPDDLGPGETLVDRRRAETEASAQVLGLHRIVWLPYHDSGMSGWKQNGDERSFFQADTRVAAEQLAAVLVEEAADVLVVYDWHGIYGHPDHVKVHQVGHRAAALAAEADVAVRLVEVTANRDAFARMAAQAHELGMPVGEGDEGFDPEAPADDGNPFGEPESAITLAVDVLPYVGLKRASMACHASQITDTSFFLQMSEEAFAFAFGTEWYIEHGIAASGPRPGWLFE